MHAKHADSRLGTPISSARYGCPSPLTSVKAVQGGWSGILQAPETLNMSFLSQEMTDHDLAAWTDDLLTRIELRVLMEHEVIDHRGNDAAFQNRCPQSSRNSLAVALGLR